MHRLSPAALYRSIDYRPGLFWLSKLAAWRAGCSWQGRSRQHYGNPSQQSHYLTLHCSHPWLAASEVPPFACPPTTQKGKNHHQKEKEKEKPTRQQEGSVTLTGHSRGVWQRKHTGKGFFRVTDSWGDTKGRSIRETLELEALFLTKEYQQGGWGFSVVFLNSFLLPRDPTLTKSKLVQRCQSCDSETLVLKFLAQTLTSCVTLGKSFSLCCASASNPYGESNALQASYGVISDCN